MKYDVAIIGGGPAGYTAAEKAGAAGLSVVLFEKNALGGVCLNEGCIPAKTLLYSAKVYDALRNAAKYGVKAENAGFDLPKIIARKNKVVKKLTAGVRMKLSREGVALVNGEALIMGRAAGGGSLHIACGGEMYEASRLILCTGSETFLPPIPGLSETACWSSREALQAGERPASLVVAGGGVVGMEFASFFNSLGTEVHVVEMLDGILPGMDREAAAMLRNEYARRGVRFYTGCRVKEISNRGVLVEKGGESFAIRAERVLLSLGRRPVVRGFGLETLGVELLGHGVRVNGYMQTSAPQVYACGDITGFSMLAHAAVGEAETAVRHILGEAPRQMSYKAIPGVVYTNPEIAGVGATEEQLQAEGRRYSVRKLPMTFSGRFVAENEMAGGLCKLIVEEDGTIAGAHLMGNPSSELISLAGVAVEKGYKAWELASFVFPHPTVGEILKEAAGQGG